MKIAFTGLNLPEGKTKYDDPTVIVLAEKFDPKKVSPYYFEFLPDDYEEADAIVISEDSILDLLILDIEKIEGRLDRTEDDEEKELLERCLVQLEQSEPLCDLKASPEEKSALRALGFLSFKPVVIGNSDMDANTVCAAVLQKAAMMFFYTAGKQEVHAWLVERGADALACAGKIHTDLARGFIRAELVDRDDLLSAHNFNDARAKGLTRLVDKDYVLGENTVLEIRFNV